MRKRTTNTGMWLPSATSVTSFFFLASFLKHQLWDSFFPLSLSFFVKSLGLKVPQASSWFGFLSSLPSLENLSWLFGFHSWAGRDVWWELGKGSWALIKVLLHFCGCSGLLMQLMFAQCKVLYEHQGLFSLPEPITQQRILSLSAWAYCKWSRYFFCLSLQCFLDYSSIILKQFWGCSILLSSAFSCAFVFPRHGFTWSLTFLSRIEGWDSPLPKPFTVVAT